MRRKRKVIGLRLRSILRRPAVDRELDKELRFHLERQIEENLAAGMSAEEARFAAMRTIGGITQVTEECREMRGLSLIQNFFQDFRYALRVLRRNRGFASAAILSLALGIGANIAIFSVIESLLLRPLPFRNPQQLWSVTKLPDKPILTPVFAAWRSGGAVFSGLAAWNDEQFNLTGNGDAEHLSAAAVNADFFRVLGVQPVIGRDFAVSEDQTEPANLVLITHDLWMRRFGGDPRWLGQSVVLNDAAYTLIGVLPASFRFPGDLRPELFVPGGFSAAPDWNAERMGMLRVIARMAPETSPARASEDLSAIEMRYKADIPAWLGKPAAARQIGLTRLQTQLAGDLRPVMLILLSAVGLVLLITCANVAGLQMARASARSAEMAIRVALGGSRSRLLSMLICESLVLGIAGTILGLAGACGLMPLMRSVTVLHLASPGDLRIDTTVLLFAGALALATVVLFGLVPSLSISRQDVNRAIKSGARAITAGWSWKARSILVAGEIGLALILLLGAGLLTKSMAKVLSVSFGLEPSGVLTFRLRLPESHYNEAKERTFTEELVRRVKALPGVQSAAATNALPLAGYSVGGTITFDGQPPLPKGEGPSAAIISITPDYFKTMRVPVLEGRPFLESDSASTERVAIVNARFAQRFYPNEEAVGKRIRWFSNTWATIVGISANVRHKGLDKDPEAEVFVPFPQQPASVVAIALRTSLKPASLASAAESEVHQMDRDLPVYGVTTMEDRLAASTSQRRIEMILVSAFAGLSLLLAISGVYGMMAYAVSQRTREFGVRIALGAESRDILGSVVRRAGWLALAGVVPGLIGGYFLTRYMESLLYQVHSHDPAIFCGAALALILAALAASFAPARRAAHIDPVRALRWE